MSQITTHILDTARGCPAAGVAITLDRQSGEGWDRIGAGLTDADGRIADLCPPDAALEAGTYRIHFATGDYFSALNAPVFYPWAEVVFCIEGDGQHYHIPLLLAAYAYSTYRGS
ncbi:MAG: hydroxyisourate hydrolase [Gammaproteobacteria bacterium]|nr:hydroxyisourate hydrolase [Gammaproteobacteria bacterium]